MDAIDSIDSIDSMDDLIAACGCVAYIVVVYVVFVYGYITTYVNDPEKVCEIVDKSFDAMRWFIPCIFVSGYFLDWKMVMLYGVWYNIILIRRFLFS